MKRKLAIALSTLLATTSLSGLCACASNNYGVKLPDFADSEGVVFTAYSAMTVENWSGGSGNVSTLTDEHFQKFVDAGFNRIIAIHEGARVKIQNKAIEWNENGVPTRYDVSQTLANAIQRANEDAMKVLPLAEKYGVKYYVRDWAFYDMYKEENYNFYSAWDTREIYEDVIRQMFSEDNEYIHSPAYCGNFGRDEPEVGQFERLKWQIEIYNEVMEEYGIEGEFLLNLLPAYGSSTHFGGGYSNYINKYFDELAPLLGYVSWDYYPFKQSAENGSQMRTSMVSNLSAMAKKCKEGDYELRAFVQTGGDFTGLRDLTSIGDFRLQVYTNLAFGARQMTYYEYGTFNSQNEGEFGLINLQDGTYNYTYDMAKTVNNEVHAFEDAYMNFKWDNLMTFSSLGQAAINPHFWGVSSLKSHPRIGDVSITEDAIMGTFKDADGNDAFMLVNYTDPYFNKNNTVTIQFKDTDALLMYRLGKQEVVKPDKDGKYTFELYPGEGRFIIPLKK